MEIPSELKVDRRHVPALQAWFVCDKYRSKKVRKKSDSKQASNKNENDRKSKVERKQHKRSSVFQERRDKQDEVFGTTVAFIVTHYTNLIST